MGCRQTGALPRPEPAETGFVAVPRALSLSYLVNVAISYPASPRFSAPVSPTLPF